MTETVRSNDGTEIAFDCAGDGPALILVGGAFSERSAAGALSAALAPRFTVYGYDRRGRGASGDTPPYAVDREIEDLDALITAAGGSARVFGVSSGAVLSLEAAARHLAIAKLAVYEPPYVVGDDRVRTSPDLADRLSEQIDAGRRGDAARLFLVEAVEMPPDVVDMIQAGPGWPAMEAVAHTLRYDVAIVGDQSIPADRMAMIATPTLALAGGASPEWARNGVAALAAAIPGARHMTLDGQTHAVNPDIVAPLLVDFLL